ncbi:MAG: hypothetical protein ABMA64_34445 [Myxococcota bacterium]
MRACSWALVVQRVAALPAAEPRQGTPSSPVAHPQPESSLSAVSVSSGGPSRVSPPESSAPLSGGAPVSNGPGGGPVAVVVVAAAAYALGGAARSTVHEVEAGLLLGWPCSAAGWWRPGSFCVSPRRRQ